MRVKSDITCPTITACTCDYYRRPRMPLDPEAVVMYRESLPVTGYQLYLGVKFDGQRMARIVRTLMLCELV